MIYKDKPPISDNLVEKRINSVITQNGYDINIATIIAELYTYMRKKSLRGGCHALSSVLYVMLSEIGETPKLYIGECQKPGEKPFDHSWICLDDKIIDLAIYIPLTMPINSTSGPVIFDVDIVTMKKTEVVYGINTGLPMDNQTNLVLEHSFTEYMSNFPMEYGGLWTVAQEILLPVVDISRENLIEKYKDVNRVFVR